MNRILPALLLFWITGLQAQENKKWTLERCIEYALQKNIGVRQAELSSRLSKNDNLQSKMNLLPSIDANGSYNLNFGNSLNPVTFSFVEANSQSGSASMQANLPIFTGLQQIFNIERTKYDLLASKFDLDAARNNVALSVSSAFLQILLNGEILKVAEKQKELTTAQKATVESRVKAGAMAENMLLEAEAQLARDEANVVNARGVFDLSVLALRQLLQLPASETLEVDVPELNADRITGIGSVTSASVFDYALSNQPSIKSAEARVKSATASRKISIGALSPVLAVFGSLSTGYFSEDKRFAGIDTASGSFLYQKVAFQDQLKNNFRKVAGLSLNIPLFAKGQKLITISNSKIQYQIRELQLENAKNTLRQDIEQAYANANAAAQSYFANKKSYEAAQKSFNMLEKRYSNGLTTNFDLQQSKNTLAVAESEMLRAKYNFVFRQKVLDFYQGKPITLNQ